MKQAPTQIGETISIASIILLFVIIAWGIGVPPSVSEVLFLGTIILCSLPFMLILWNLRGKIELIGKTSKVLLSVALIIVIFLSIFWYADLYAYYIPIHPLEPEKPVQFPIFMNDTLRAIVTKTGSPLKSLSYYGVDGEGAMMEIIAAQSNRWSFFSSNLIFGLLFSLSLLFSFVLILLIYLNVLKAETFVTSNIYLRDRKDLIDMIQFNKIGDAIGLMLEKSDNARTKDKLILMMAELNDANLQFGSGVINNEEYGKIVAKIRWALINLIT